MSESSLSFDSTKLFRNNLLGRNLKPYKIPGIFTPKDTTPQATNLSDYNVIDSPGELLTNGSFSNQLYPLNGYGPDGGYNLNISFNNPPLTQTSNKGEYDLSDSKLELVNEFYIDAAFVTNKYGPEGGYNSLVVIDDIQNNEKISLPYWDPPVFNPSSYSPYNIITTKDPSGSDGQLSEDSYIARLGARSLKKLFEERISTETYKSVTGVRVITTTKGDQSYFSYNDFKITKPLDGSKGKDDLLSRVEGVYSPESPIPGDYFEEIKLNLGLTLQVSSALSVVNRLTGGLLGPIPVKTINPSEIFLENTGQAQKSVLFSNLEYNRYKPTYKKNVSDLLKNQGNSTINVNLINSVNDTLNSSYYVGSRNSEPSSITSPTNQVPVNPYGQQEQVSVYGPSEVSILYEGNRNLLNFGLAGKPISDGGSVDGQFVWTSPRYKGNAGFKATPGGGTLSYDKEYNQISSTYQKNESTNITFKQGSILDNTQRLVESADNVSGIAKLKHVGNAINQVSKVFNDGYKELTKGSQVVSYTDFTDGSEKGIEYCRVFTKDTPFYTYADLQKTDGITKSGRRFTNSVLDNTYNLNITPLKGIDSTNLIPNNSEGKGGHVKKYMFSIENLAWRTSSKPGFTYDDLPVCEKGPNGGRIMWFPPYDISFSDSSNASWNPVEFMGRPEPIYTYKNTTRTGTLTFKIIVDNPSVTNMIIEQQLKGANKERVNSILDSFFAGCVKYDIYKLGLKFNTIPSKDLVYIKEILENPRLTTEEAKSVVAEIPVTNTDVKTEEEKVDPNSNLIEEYKKKYGDLTFYFDNDIPKNSNENYEDTYNSYVNESRKNIYTQQSNSEFDSSKPYCIKNPEYCLQQKNVGTFFGTAIEWNYSKLNDFITDTNNLFDKNAVSEIKITFKGSASAVAKPTYNKSLSQRRIDSVRNFLTNKVVGGISLKNLFENKKISVTESPEGEDVEVTPITNGGNGKTVNCSEDITGGTKVTSTSQVYSTNAMACRKVRINSILTKVPTPPKKEPVEPVTNTDTVTLQPIKPKSTKRIEQKLKEGISKKILRNLLTECDYFQVVKESNPMVYDSIKEKIKYFSPAFHSMTPEGLNARLTFLNQCVRPGETIPVIVDGKPTYNEAQNTSFGSPPVLILRIGDFYHTKIIPDNLSFTYTPITLDINPEGIGVQPMIVNVSMGFKMIGGHGLKEPIDRLQNALSFNYYANTEIYDERSLATEDTSKLDKQIFDSIVEKEKPATINNIENKEQNDGGNTIGEILTNIPVTGGQTGDTSYQKIMDGLITSTQKYSENVINQLEKIVLNYNYGILQLTTKERLYKLGNTSGTTTGNEVKIFGSVNGEYLNNGLRDVYDYIIRDIVDNETNPIIEELFKDTRITSDDRRTIKYNMSEYITNMVSNFSTSLFSTIQEIVLNEQDFIQNIRKINFVVDKSDGKLLSGNMTRIYNLTPTNEVSQKTTSGVATPTNTYEELVSDYTKFNTYLNGFDSFLTNKGIVTNTYEPIGGFVSKNKNFINTEPNKRFFMFMSRILQDKNKRNDFIKSVIKGDLTKSKTPVNLLNEFTKVIENLSNQYDKELIEEEKIFKELRKDKDYKSYINGVEEQLYPKGKVRKFTYTTVPDQSKIDQQRKYILDLYSTTNTNTDKTTFDGKVKFDS